MKVAVIGASGRVGSRIVEEALERGLEVTGIARSKAKVAFDIPVIEKDILALSAEDLDGFDGVFDAFGVWEQSLLHLYKDTAGHLAELLSGTQTRLLIVGGTGSLYVDDQRTTRLYESEGFPRQGYPLARATSEALFAVRDHADLKWTYISPAGSFDPDGVKTGRYLVGDDRYFENSRGESYISYADYAVAMVDEMESGNHIQEHISVVGE